VRRACQSVSTHAQSQAATAEDDSGDDDSEHPGDEEAMGPRGTRMRVKVKRLPESPEVAITGISSHELLFFFFFTRATAQSSVALLE